MAAHIGFASGKFKSRMIALNKARACEYITLRIGRRWADAIKHLFRRRSKNVFNKLQLDHLFHRNVDLQNKLYEEILSIQSIKI